MSFSAFDVHIIFCQRKSMSSFVCYFSFTVVVWKSHESPVLNVAHTCFQWISYRILKFFEIVSLLADWCKRLQPYRMIYSLRLEKRGLPENEQEWHAYRRAGSIHILAHILERSVYFLSQGREDVVFLKKVTLMSPAPVRPVSKWFFSSEYIISYLQSQYQECNLSRAEEDHRCGTWSVHSSKSQGATESKLSLQFW